MMKSRRSYLLKPYYDWIVASECTPYLSVDATYPGVKVPKQFVQNGQIVLNLKPAAIRNLAITTSSLSFDATFGGQEESIFMPIAAVQSLYSRETQEGIVFDEQDDEGEPPPESLKSNFRVID